MMKNFTATPGRLLMLTGILFIPALPPAATAADGAQGSNATPLSNAGGGAGGTVDPLTAAAGRGGAGGIGGLGQSSADGHSGSFGNVNGAETTLSPGMGGSGNRGNAASTHGGGAAGGGGGAGAAALMIKNRSENTVRVAGGDGGRGGNGGANNSNQPVSAQGGNGGDGGQGGSAIWLSNQATLINLDQLTGGRGGTGADSGMANASSNTLAGQTLYGGSGGNGGTGGHGITLLSGYVENSANSMIWGGAGGNGGQAGGSNTLPNPFVQAVGGKGGLGGEGGDGIYLTGMATITNDGSITGGNGGNGGNSGAARGHHTVIAGNGAQGGRGGSGINAYNSAIIINHSEGLIRGGNGGTGGGANTGSQGDVILGGYGANGGEGGSGIYLQNGGAVYNSGSVAGGNGNTGGSSGDTSEDQQVGNAGMGGSSGDTSEDQQVGNAGMGGHGLIFYGPGEVLNAASGTIVGGNGANGAYGARSEGGTGGSGVVMYRNALMVNQGILSGGHGGNGSNAKADGGDGGYGFSGGHGIEIRGKSSLYNLSGAQIFGGNGGTGGGSANNDFTRHGGAGGQGGSAILVEREGMIFNEGNIIGGNGNFGGGGGDANGGQGGTGVESGGQGGWLYNNGMITGGTGGEAGSAGNIHGQGREGAGGYALSGQNLTVINSGMLSGGKSFSGIRQSQAIVFNGGINRLELHRNSHITGIVNAIAGENTLTLGGDENATFDTSSIGPANQYRGFSAFDKRGESTWLLTGRTDNVTPWTIKQGILVVSDDSSLGAVTSPLILDGGTLQYTPTLTLAPERPLELKAGNGTIDTQEQNPVISQSISGNGGMNKSGNGRLTLSGKSSYTGGTDLRQGALEVNGALLSTITARTATLLSGTGSAGGLILEPGSRLQVGSYQNNFRDQSRFTVNGNVVNRGVINVGYLSQPGGNLLRINGNYQGDSGSTIVLHTVLGGDDSATDRVAIAGDAHGRTALIVRNFNGKGADTEAGIRLVTVAGNNAPGSFFQQNRVVAGQYDYALVQRNNSWYLSSQLPGTGEIPVDDPEEGESPDTGEGGSPPLPGGNDNPPGQSENTPPTNPGSQRIIRPETGAYIANHYAANRLFSTIPAGSEIVADQASEDQALWLRQKSSHAVLRSGDTQITSKSNLYALQLGNRMFQTTTNQVNRLSAGLMAGYGFQSGLSRSSVTGYQARSELHGYSIGTYGNWLQNAVQPGGVWINSGLLYNWFSNQVSGQDLPTERYRSSGFTASIETGYIFNIYRSSQYRFYWSPLAQLSFMDVTSEPHREHNGSRIQAPDKPTVQSQLGMRYYIEAQPAFGSSPPLRSWLSLSWLHNNHDASVTLGEERNGLQGSRNSGLASIGLEGALTSAVSLNGNVSGEMGHSHYQNTSLQVGITVRF